MKGVSSSPAKRNEGFYRYLRPGALAQIRNSRINARSSALLARSLIRRLDSPMPESPRQIFQISTIDHVPDLVSKLNGPYCLQRKKLVAARSISILNLNASSISLLESTGGNDNSLSNDAVVAH